MADFAQISSNEPNYPTNPPPSDSSANFLTPYKIGSGTQRGVQMIGGPNLLSDSADTRILVKDSSNTRVIMGRIGTGVNDYGLKVSRSGVDVTTATNDQLVFNSSQDVFKIVQTGTIVLSQGAFTGTAGTYQEFFGSASQLHGLSYTPIVLSVLNLGGVYVPMPYTTLNNTGAGPSWVTYSANTDPTSINFNYVGLTFGAVTVASSTLSLKYYLLQESAN